MTYRNEFPPSLEGYSAIFLSFGNPGSGGTLFDDQMAAILLDYLQGGGYAYLEGANALGEDQVNNIPLLGLFGLLTATGGTGVNTINSLEGKPTAITHDMIFTANSQVSNSSIDKYAPSSSGKTAFTESGYGTVAVQYEAASGSRTFCFSYALAALTDAGYPNTREELLHRILNFFDIYTGEPEVGKLTLNRLNIYPNPSHDQITVVSSEIQGNKNFSIFTVSGEKVMERQLTDNETKIDISALPRGVYFVRLQNEKMVEVGKIVKQ